MKIINLRTDCANCGEEITKKVADLTGSNETTIYIDLEIEGDGFDCNACGQNTSIMLSKESN